MPGVDSLAVVVPMHNEEAGARRCIDAISAVITALTLPSRLVVVDDGSTDRTADILAEAAAAHPDLVVRRHERNGGYGAGLRTGAQAAADLGLEWVLFMDSDLTNPPGDIPRFVAAAGPDVDLVKATRYTAGGQVVDVPFRRRAISVVGNRYARLAGGLGLSDPTNGFRAWRVAEFLRLPLTERGFPVIMEELYWAHRRGLRTAEIPSTLSTRDATLKASSFAYRPGVLWAYARYPLRTAAHRLLRTRPRAPRPAR